MDNNYYKWNENGGNDDDQNRSEQNWNPQSAQNEEPVIPEPDQFQETSSSDVNYEPVSTESNEPLNPMPENTMDTPGQENSLYGIVKPHDQKTEGNGNNIFYTETVKTKQKSSLGFGKVVIISLISAIVGGTVFGFVSTGIQKNNGNGLSSNVTYYAKELASTEEQKADAENGRTPLNSEQIAEKVGPAIVGIISSIESTVPFFGTTVQQGSGSGIIINQEGYIVTNNHVVEGAADNKVQVILSSGETYEASIIGTDSRTDLAVIKIEPKEDLHYAILGDSSDIKAGETAIAIGNPLGQEFAGSVTQGVISAVNRSVQVEDKQLKLIQTDAAINPGNSGGALVNSYGEVIGINTVKITQEGVEGLGFAIPINEAKPIIEDLIKDGYVKGRPVIGISGRAITEDISKIYGYPTGVMVMDIQPFSGAELGGLKTGDIIQKVNGEEVTTVDEINEIRDEHKAGDQLTMDIVRNNEKMTLTITLGEEKPETQQQSN